MHKATETKPTRRAMVAATPWGDDEYTVEIGDRTITVRQKGGRKGGPTEVRVGIGKLYVGAMREKVEQERAAKRAAAKARRKQRR